MKFSLFAWIFFFCFSAFAERPYLTFPSDIAWKTQRSEHFQVLYRSGQGRFAQRTLRAAEKAHRLLAPLFPGSPPVTSIILADFSDSLNGYSLNFPYHHFVVYGTPPDSTNELSELDSWLDSVVLHEYAHTLHLFPANGLWKFLRIIFGTAIVPNGMMPQHLHEGLATYLETHFTQGGRGKGPTFDMISRMAVHSGVFGNTFTSLDLLDGSFSRWPQGRSPYFFGYLFYSHLLGSDNLRAIHSLTLASSKNFPYWVNRPFNEVFNLDLADIWKDIRTQEIAKREAEISEIKKAPLSSLDYVTQTKFQKTRLVSSSNQSRLAYLSEHPDSGRKLVILDSATGKETESFPLRFAEAGGLCFKEKSNQDVFVFSASTEQNGYALNRLSIFRKGEKTTFSLKTHAGSLEHIKEFDCQPDLTAYLVAQESGGQGTLKLYQGPIPGPERYLTERFSWKTPEETWISSVLFGSPHYFLLRKGMMSSLFAWSPPQKPQFLGSIPGHAFHLKKQSPDSLLLITSLSGRYEVWSWNLLSNQLTPRITVLGGVNSFAVSNGMAFVSSYEHQGYDIARTQMLKDQPGTPKVEPSTEPLELLPSDEAELVEEEYSPWSSLVPRTWIPSALFVPFGLQIGAWIPMFDLSQKHFYDLTFGLDRRQTESGNESLPLASVLYGYRFGESSQVDINSYFSPGFLTLSKSFFKQWGNSLNYSWRLWKSLFQMRFSALFRRLESSSLGPANQSVGLGYGIGWSSRNSLDAFSPQLDQTGLAISINHQQFIKEFGSNQSYFSTIIRIDSVWTNPLWQSSLWSLNLRQGYTEGTPFYNSFFQGGGEILFSQGREFFLNRGYLQGSFVGRRMFGANFEFQFPISRIERGFELLPVFLNRISGALVLDTTSYDFGSLSKVPHTWMREFLWSTGFELTTGWKFFYYLPTTLRAGFYRGLSQGGEPFYFTLGLEASL